MKTTQQMENYRWLLSGQATNYLTDTGIRLTNGDDIVRLVRSLRKSISPEQSALVLELSQLRLKAKKKFDHADQMFFTGRTLEMATDQRIASFKARRFSDTTRVADVCCGIGGDCLGLANANSDIEAVGYDKDELVVMYANANLAANGFPPTVLNQSFEEIDCSAFASVHIDPERRKQGRSTRGDRFSPSLGQIAAQTGGHDSVALKVAPATKKQDYNQHGKAIERQWIGHSRECKQQVIWLGNLAMRPNCRSAVRLGNSGSVTEFFCDDQLADAARPKLADEIGDYVYEPHNVVLAAELTNAIACELELNRLAPEIAYLTCDNIVSHKLLSRFKVLEVMPSSLSKVTSAIGGYDFGELEIKKRGVPEYVAENYKRIKLSGRARGTVILTQFQNRRTAIIAKRETGV